ncbi:MAG: twin-arginine translocation signal domain-containing protein, partial [Mycobacteriales bacterium]
MDQQHGRAPSSTRRQFLGRSAAIGVAAAVTGSASALGPRGAVAEAAQGGKAQDETNTMRAVASYDAMQKYFYHPDVKLYQEQYPFAGGNAYSYVWPFSQAFAATTYIAGLRGLEHRYRDDVQDRITGLEPYYSATGRSPNAAITPNYPSPPGYDSY